MKLPAPCSLTGDCPAKRSGIEKLAFVTLISGEESSGYVQGAAALATSLDAVNSTIARVCMVTDDVPKQSVEVLELRGYKVVEVKAVACRPSRSISVIRKTDAYNNYCTKVQIWTLTDYDKLIFLDADALVLRNIDHLFDLDSAFAVAPDSGCPEHGNTGVFVLQPSIEVHAIHLFTSDSPPQHHLLALGGQVFSDAIVSSLLYTLSLIHVCCRCTLISCGSTRLKTPSMAQTRSIQIRDRASKLLLQFSAFFSVFSTSSISMVKLADMGAWVHLRMFRDFSTVTATPLGRHGTFLAMIVRRVHASRQRTFAAVCRSLIAWPPSFHVMEIFFAHH